MNEKINIQVSRGTHRELKELGKKGESFDDVIIKFLPVKADLTATTDSYSNSYPFVAIDEIICFIKNQRKESEYKYNLYSGGEQDSTMAMIKCYRPGFDRKDCIKLQFSSDTQCRIFEERIKHLFDGEDFNPRIFHYE